MSLKWRLQSAMAMLGVRLLGASGWYNGYFNHWRGAAFDDAQKRGLHILPVHYYSPIPDTRTIGADPQAARKVLDAGILDASAGLALVEELSAAYGDEYNRFPKEKPDDPHQYYTTNPGYPSADGAILHAMVRRLKPRKIVEIGCGCSSLVISAALRLNRKEDPSYQCAYKCIEPYPPEYLTPLPSEVTELIPDMLQNTPLALIENLGAGDLLFIDSTHVSGVSSDVVYEYLLLLRLIKPGVIIHIHDIFLPDDYPAPWIHESRFFWNEQYLLQAFLLFNNAFEVILPAQFVYQTYREQFLKLIPDTEVGQGFGPSSFWMKRK